MVSGMVKINRYPLAAATKANAIPVFPDVGSIKTVSFFIELDAGERIEGFKLSHDVGNAAFGHSVQPYQRGIPDGLCDIIVYPSHFSLLLSASFKTFFKKPLLVD
jgi:hypothetical protein